MNSRDLRLAPPDRSAIAVSRASGVLCFAVDHAPEFLSMNCGKPLVPRVCLAALVWVLLAVGSAPAAEAPPAYVKTVMTMIVTKVVYPKMAQMRHQEGKVSINVTVDGGGVPSAVDVDKSSGIQSLDEAALAAARAAAPFPPPPEAGVVVHGIVTFEAQ